MSRERNSTVDVDRLGQTCLKITQPRISYFSVAASMGHTTKSVSVPSPDTHQHCLLLSEQTSVRVTLVTLDVFSSSQLNVSRRGSACAQMLVDDKLEV